MCIMNDVYCFHCGKQFTKKNKDLELGIWNFEECPHCGKGFDDLTKEAQFAVKMVIKPLEDIKKSFEQFILS